MKKGLSLLLVLVMLLVSFTSCGGGGKTDTNKTERVLLTLKCAIIVDDITTVDGIKAMQTAFNEVCKQKYSTAIEFFYCTADQYEAMMDAEMERIAAEKLAGGNSSGSASGSQTNTGAVEKDEYGMTVPKYPEVKSTQFDLVLICNQDMYNRYIEKEWIQSLNTQLENVYQRIMPTILSSVQKEITVDGKIFGIPARSTVGEYTYLALNKKVVDALHINPDSIDSVADAYSIFLNIQNSSKSISDWADELTEDGETFSAIWNKEESFEYANAISISADGGFSALGASFVPKAAGKNALTFTNLLMDNDYCRYLEMVVNAKNNDYFGEENADEFIVGLVDGDYAKSLSNDDYYYCVLNLPRVDADDIFNGMLSVSSYTVNVARSVEIIQELMTNSQLLNILLYGAPTNYAKSNEGVVSFRVSSDYRLDPNHLVGNLQFYADPCADYGQDVNYGEYVSKHNEDLRDMFFDATWENYYRYIDEEMMATVDALSRQYRDDLLDSGSVAEFRATLADIQEEMMAVDSTDETVKANALIFERMMDEDLFYFDSINTALSDYRKGS